MAKVFKHLVQWPNELASFPLEEGDPYTKDYVETYFYGIAITKVFDFMEIAKIGETLKVYNLKGQETSFERTE